MCLFCVFGVLGCAVVACVVSVFFTLCIRFSMCKVCDVFFGFLCVWCFLFVLLSLHLCFFVCL